MSSDDVTTVLSSGGEGDLLIIFGIDDIMVGSPLIKCTDCGPEQDGYSTCSKRVCGLQRRIAIGE